MDALDKDIKENGCHQCGDELKPGALYDEGIEKNFCNIKCQLEFYMSEYDRLIEKSNKLGRRMSDMSIEMLTILDAVNQGLGRMGLVKNNG